MLAEALRQVPGSSKAKILVRVDGAGATHELLDHLEKPNTKRRTVRCLVGWTITEESRPAAIGGRMGPATGVASRTPPAIAVHEWEGTWVVESDLALGDVRIREVEDNDLDVFFEQQLEPEAIRKAAFPARTRDAFMAHWAGKIRADPTVLARTVVADGRVAGYIVCWEQSGKRWVGYWYGQDFWGRGIATRALALFLGVVQTRPLYADTLADNTGSVRVLEKCGFRCITHETPPPTTDTDPRDQVVFLLESQPPH